MLNVVIGFLEEDAKKVADLLEGGIAVVISPRTTAPKHIALAGTKSLPKAYHYVPCKMETRTLLSAARAAYFGEEVEFMRLYPQHNPLFR